MVVDSHQHFWKYEPTRFLSERGERREIKIPVHLLCNCHMKDFHIPKPQEAEIIKIKNFNEVSK